jgi:hypothetical protein
MSDETVFDIPLRLLVVGVTLHHKNTFMSILCQNEACGYLVLRVRRAIVKSAKTQ